MVHYIADFIGSGLRAIQADYPDWFVGIRQNGVVMGLEFDHPQGAKFVMRHLYENGVWAIFSTLDPRVLQFKPGILLKPELAEELLDRTEVAIGKAWREMRGAARRRCADDGGDLRDAHRAAGVPARPGDARAGRVGRPRLRPLRQPERLADRRGGRRGRRGPSRASSPSGRWPRPGSASPSTRCVKNLACSTGIVDTYRGHDYVSAERRPADQDRRDSAARRRGPRADPVDQPGRDGLLQDPAGPDDPQRDRDQPAPATRRRCAPTPPGPWPRPPSPPGAPDGVVQVVDEPSIPLINALMTDERTDVIVATGGTAVVRAAYRSGNPAIGVGPGNVPVLVDAHRRPAAGGPAHRGQQGVRQLDPVHQRERAHRRGARSPTGSLRHMQHARRLPAHRRGARPGPRRCCSPTATSTPRMVGKDAAWIAEQAGIRVRSAHQGPARPVRPVGARRSRSPTRSCARCSAWSRVAERRPRHRRRLAPSCGSPAPATRPRSTAPTPRTIMDYGAAVRVLRVSVNVGNSLGSAGIETNLAPTDDDRHRVLRPVLGGGEPRAQAPGQLDPARVQRRRPARPMADFAGLDPWRAPAGPVPAYPRRVQRGRRPPSLAPPRTTSSGPGRDRRAARGDPAAHRRGAPTDRQGLTVAELRSFIFIDQLQPQTMCYLGTWIRGLAAPQQRGRADHRDRARPGHRAADRRRAQARRGPGRHARRRAAVRLPGDPRPDRRRCGRPAPRCSRSWAPREQDATRPQVLASRDRHHARPAARVPDQPQQDRLDGAAGRVAVRARDAAGLVRDPGDQRGREGRRDQGRRLPDDRRHRPGLPDRHARPTSARRPTPPSRRWRTSRDRRRLALRRSCAPSCARCCATCCRRHGRPPARRFRPRRLPPWPHRPAVPARSGAGRRATVDGASVVLGTDADLEAFVRRLRPAVREPASTARTSGTAACASGWPPAPRRHRRRPASRCVRVERGARDRAAGARRRAAGARDRRWAGSAVLTPLARDRARALGVDIEKER